MSKPTLIAEPDCSRTTLAVRLCSASMSVNDAWHELRRAAQDAAKTAYSPYSDLSVGAAARTQSGAIYTGANIENASYGLSTCAERIAVWQAVLGEIHGQNADRHILAAVVATDVDGNVLAPCGACRQVILEFGSEAKVWLPTGTGSIQAALSAPFEATDLDPTTRPGFDKRLLKLLELDEDDKVLLMRQLVALREGAAQMYSGEVKLQNVRAILFVSASKGLVVAPGFFSNFDDPVERTICVPIMQGITGAAYSLREPNFGVPRHMGDLPGDVLPESEQQKVSSKLTWVVTWPLGDFGAVSLDGFDPVTPERMHDIAHSPKLQKRIDLIANLIERMQ